MTVTAQRETLSFQTEVKELMHLVINSLYSNSEIFLRELISNSSDACDKLRFEALSDNALLENEPDIKINISFDKAKKTITISDNGIGMSREEVIDNIGTIAKSGTKAFLSKLTGDQAKDSSLIGQFGVGFYSAFIVADKVTLTTRRAGLTAEHGVLWESAGDGEYTLENVVKTTRGTEIVLHLKEGMEEFLETIRLKTIITKYSDHITVPIMLPKPDELKGNDDPKVSPIEWSQANKATALWTLNKNDIKEEEYNDLYKHIAHDFTDPLATLHNRVEGKYDYITLFYIPQRAPFDLFQRDRRSGIKLYVKRTFIMDDAENILPNYLRFVRGVVDSSDLPLNVSREILQNNKLITNIRTGAIKKILSWLENTAAQDKKTYNTFWAQFGQVLKEGPAEDYANRERIAKLLLFRSTTQASETVSLDDYTNRMSTDQKAIYYLTAESYETAINSPHLEIFKKKGIEVLLLCDQIDEWLMSHLSEFEGKTLQSVTKGDLDLGDLEDNIDKEIQEKEKTTFESLVTQLKETLGDKVKDVRITHRLTDSPACVVADSNDMDFKMQRMMEAMGQAISAKPPIFEINPQHEIILNLNDIQDDELFAQWASVLFDQAIIAEGGHLKDPAGFVSRLNKLLAR